MDDHTMTACIGKHLIKRGLFFTIFTAIFLLSVVATGTARAKTASTTGLADPPGDSWSALPSFFVPPIRTGHTSIWTGTKLIVWGGENDQYTLPYNNGWIYDPSTDHLKTISTINAPTGRRDHTAIWTGDKMIVWGGKGSGVLNDGGIYDPATDTWTELSLVNAPSPRSSHSAVWTGTKMIVWGGMVNYLDNTRPNDGATYDPATDTWTPISTIAAPVGRAYHSAVWTGSRMLIWGGEQRSYISLGDGSFYDPVADAWSPMPLENAPAPRYHHSTVSTGDEMIIWGGTGNAFETIDAGKIYHYSSNTWTNLSTQDAPFPISHHSAVWTGSKMVVWGGNANQFFPYETNQGWIYDPASDLWSPITAPGLPPARYNHTATWTGSQMIVVGRTSDGISDRSAAWSFSLADNTWKPIPTRTAPDYRFYHSAVWTGSRMIIWGGEGVTGYLNDGWSYDPTAAVWTPISNAHALAPRSAHTAVWTGSRMIIWGGAGKTGTFNDGASYDPSTDTWTAINMINAPTARAWHTAVWTGSEMIIWGSKQSGDTIEEPDSGGIYNPQTNTWRVMAPGPSRRNSHTAVWTGANMIIWGGSYYYDNYNDGWSYDPLTDTWTNLSPVNAPSPRVNHSAVWTGTQMIIFGGCSAGDHIGYADGASYIPAEDRWVTLPTANAPGPRYWHSAILANDEMIIWGGEVSSLDGQAKEGKIFDFRLNRWLNITGNSSPQPRKLHSAVWTGKEMIIWGGNDEHGNLFNDGARYFPILWKRFFAPVIMRFSP